MSGISIDAVLRRLTIKGQEIYSELLNAIATNGRRYIPFLELAPRYITNIDVSTIPAGYNGREICHMLEEAGQPKDRYQYIGVNNVDQDGPTPYYNYVHRDGKSLLCFYNFAELDTNGNERMHWSDLMAVCCSRIMSVNGRSDMANIEWIWRISIVNEETKSVIDAIDQRRSPNLMARNRVVDLTSEDDDFFSLLGTVHGKGPARMLAAYPLFFGGKIMKRVRIYPASSARANPHICWFLEMGPVQPPEPPQITSPLSRKARRHEKKKSRSSQSSLA